MRRTITALLAITATALLLTAITPVASAAVEPTAERTLALKGGGCVTVATRYHDPDYSLGDPIAIDPLIGTCFPIGDKSPQVVAGAVELRRRGFAPCLAGSKHKQDRADCVQGSPPISILQGSVASFSFTFSQLFHTAHSAPSDSVEVASGTPPPSFGYASFRVTLDVVAENGGSERVEFPVGVTVRQGARRADIGDRLLDPYERSGVAGLVGLIAPVLPH